MEGHLCSLARTWGSSIFHALCHRALTPPDHQEAGALAQIWTLAIELSVDITDWIHGEDGHHSTQMGWHIAKDAELTWKYSDLVNAITACPVCFKQYSRHLPKASEATHWCFQLVRDWHIDYIGPFPLSEGSKYALVCGDIACGLTQAFSYCCTNQAATNRGLEKLSTVYGYSQ